MTMPRMTSIVARDDANRAPRFLLTAHAMSVPFSFAFDIVDQALDCDTAADLVNPISTVDPVFSDALLTIAQSSVTSDDDFDEFRRELSFFLLPATEYIATYPDQPIDFSFDIDLVRRVNAIYTPIR